MNREEYTCGDCIHWIPNGGILNFGYCRQNQMGYRKFNQKACKKYDKLVTNIK